MVLIGWYYYMTYTYIMYMVLVHAGRLGVDYGRLIVQVDD
jgi:hypothetical protein